MLDVRVYDASCFMRGEAPAPHTNLSEAGSLRSRFSGVTVPAIRHNRLGLAYRRGSPDPGDGSGVTVPASPRRAGKCGIIFILLFAKFMIYYVATGPASGVTRRAETAKFIF